MSTPTPSFLIPSTPAQDFYTNLVADEKAIFNMMNVAITKYIMWIWKNPDTVNLGTPDKTWAALGTTAVWHRKAFQTMMTAINTIAPGAIVFVEPTAWTLTENADGSITCVKAS